MGAMFRSEEMALVQLFVQPEAAYPSISELGETGVVQFRDLNEEVNVFQRKFVNEVRRCNEMERKLRYIEGEVRKDNFNIPDVTEFPKAPDSREIIDLEAHLEKTESEIMELSESAVSLKSDFLELTELKHVLQKTQIFFIEQESNGDLENKALIPEDTYTQNVSASGSLGAIAGVIKRERLPAFERMLWRISRGNIFLRQAEIEKLLEDPITGKEMVKTVFYVFFQGEQLKSLIKKVCTGFHASIYPCPSTTAERQEMLKSVRTRLEDLNLILNQTEDHRQRVLVNVAKQLQNWSVMVRKMKAIYHTLNFFDLDATKKSLIGEFWVPVKDIPVVQKALVDVSNACGSSIPSFLNVIPTTKDPPTFNRTDKFTRGFQNLIDSYGVPTYREVNPALYTIITFPFLFAIMFGDAGHGLILFLFALFMCVKEKMLQAKKIDSEVWNIFFSGRYIILLMGIFSIYTGIFYNDVFSKSVNIFGTSWMADIKTYNFSTVDTNEYLTLNPSSDFGESAPYPVGVDPIWQIAKNKIIFLNSYKMKLSIIFGVLHMIFGVCLSVVNYSYFRKMENLFFDFLPQMLFLICLFFWMVIMMFMKWIMYSADLTTVIKGSSCAPSVLILFINMMLFKENIPSNGCEIYMFEEQKIVQYILVATALLCIPVMLLAKPIYIASKRKSQKKMPETNGDINQGMELQPEVVQEETDPTLSHVEHEEEPMSEVYITQAIHTIEYVLKLSEVLWNMVLKMGLTQSSYMGAIMLYLIFGAWVVLTVGILVMMEGLSAFLHTLRLHWVEFMSKFYKGLGYPFQPFSFKILLEESKDDED